MSSTPRPRRIAATLNAVTRRGKALKQLAMTPVSPAQVLGTLKDRRTARKAASGLGLVLADRIAHVNPALWDALAGASVFLSRPYLEVLEAEGPHNIEPRYALATQDGQAVALMLFQRVTVSGGRLRKPSAAKRLLDKPLAGLQEHVLVCGNLLVWGPRAIAFAPGVDEAQLWHGVGEAMYRLRRADKLIGESDFALIKDFAGDRPETQATLRRFGYRSTETEPDMVLTLSPDWRSYDDYLASLTSSYRSAAKKLVKDCANAGLSLRDIDAAEMARRADELHALYGQVHEAQGLRLATLTPGYLPAMAQALGSRFRCRVMERTDGSWAGFVTAVADGDTTLGYYIGYDRPTNETAPVYLSLLQSTVQDAIAFGTARLSLGRTALEPKAKMGCKPEALACGMRHRVGALNWVVSALTRNATHDEPPERSPFKLAKAAAA
jgi:hypothetical protein